MGGSLSNRESRSSAGVRRVFFHDLMEDEGVRQQDQQGDRRDDEPREEVNGDVEEIRNNTQDR